MLVLDVETDGNGTFRPPTQRPTEIAWTVLNGKDIIASHQFYVNGVQHIRYGGAKRDKLFINTNGIPMSKALSMLEESVVLHRVQVLVGHNIEFDRGVLLHHDHDNVLKRFAERTMLCTMKATTNLCRLPNPSGYSSYKFPKLAELARHLNIPCADNRFHGAQYDVEITTQCVLALAEKKLAGMGSLLKPMPTLGLTGGKENVGFSDKRTTVPSKKPAVQLDSVSVHYNQKQAAARSKNIGFNVFRSLHISEQKKREDELAAQKAEEAKARALDLSMDLRKLHERVPDAKRLAVMQEDQHLPSGKANPKWKMERRHSQNGSNVTNIMGNGFVSVSKHCTHKIWPSTHTVNQIFCDWGNRHEDRCDEKLEEYLQKRVANPDDPLETFKIHHCGLVKETGDKGYSPDGYVEETYQDGTSAVVLVEYKCPFTKRNMEPINGQAFDVFDDHPSGDPGSAIYGPISLPLKRKNKVDNTICPQPLHRSGNAESKTWKAITPYYYDQVQWGMRVMQSCKLLRTNPVHMPRMQCYFVVWTPQFTQLTIIPYDEGYAKHMLVMVDLFYKKYYLPNLMLKLCGKLPHGTTYSPGAYPPASVLPSNYRFRDFYEELTAGSQRQKKKQACHDPLLRKKACRESNSSS